MPMNDVEFFKQALAAANTGIWEWNIKKNTLVWTDTVRQIFDLPEGQQITMALLESLIHPEDRKLARQKIDAAMRSGPDKNYHVRHRIIGKQSQQIRWVEGFGKVHYGENGAPSLFSGTVVDITESKNFEIEKAELLKREQEARRQAQNEKDKLENLFLKSPIPIAMMQGKQFKFILANEPFGKMVGLDKVVGLTVDDVFPTKDLSAFAILQDVFYNGRKFTANELKITADWHRTGTPVEKFFDVIYEQVPGDTVDTTLVMAMALDVTEQVHHRQRSEKNEKELIQAKAIAEEANVAKSRFVANISHEIRTPLGIIMGFADLALEQSYSPEAVRNYLSSIQRNGQMLNRLIGDILDLSKIEACRLELEIVSVPLKDLLEETVSSLQLYAHEKGISLFLKLNANLPDLIETDPTRLRQILNNVIGNAVKFTDQGHVTVTAQWLDTGIFQLYVEDTGIGITQAQKEKLFQPFTQADTSTTRRFGGTGLGLILAKELSQALGGDLTLFDSALQIGSVFSCTIKPQSAVWNPQRLQKMTIPLNIQHSSLTLDKTKILVIDDSEDNRFLITSILQTLGAETAEAENGEVGFDMAMKNDFDVILMDLQMPVMDGHKATVKLRNHGLNTPIIALTAHALMDERIKALSEGFSEYLTKPINREMLVTTIEKFRNQSRLQNTDRYDHQLRAD
jgi:signal transduction histidine kinase/CheY-like chemotaxis protein